MVVEVEAEVEAEVEVAVAVAKARVLETASSSQPLRKTEQKGYLLARSQKFEDRCSKVSLLAIRIMSQVGFVSCCKTYRNRVVAAADYDSMASVRWVFAWPSTFKSIYKRLNSQVYTIPTGLCPRVKLSRLLEVLKNPTMLHL